MTFFQGLIAVSTYLVIAFLFMQGHILLGAVTVVAYTFAFSAVALLPLAILLDGYYGAFYTVPVLSICAIGWYLVSETLRSAVNIVQSEHE
jgi:hypothetical protein